MADTIGGLQIGTSNRARKPVESDGNENKRPLNVGLILPFSNFLKKDYVKVRLIKLTPRETLYHSRIQLKNFILRISVGR